MSIVVSYSSYMFWLGCVVAVTLTAALLWTGKYGLKGFKFKTADLIAAGLNHRQRRKWRAAFRRKHKLRKRRR